MAELIISEAAQKDIDEISRLHHQLVGPKSAAKAVDRIFMALSRLRDYPLSGRLAQDEVLYRLGCRLLVIGKYICIYRLVGNDIVIYRVADGRRDYPSLFKKMK